jgi:hypothetical protein
MASLTRAPRREDDAKPRRLRQDRARLEHAHRRAPRCLHALAQARFARGRPETRAAAVEWRLQAQVKRRGHIFAVRCPPVCGCRSADERTPVRVGAKPLPGRLLGARPQQPWSRPWHQRGHALWRRLWPQVADQSPAPQRRWPWPWVADDRVGQPAGPPLGWVGTWERGQAPRVRLGSAGRLLVVGMGDGPRVIPVDGVSRRPDPVGPGRPGGDQRPWWQVRLQRTWTVRPRRCRRRPAPLSGADRWCGDAAVLAHVQTPRHGTWLVAGQRRSVCSRAAGRRGTGADLRPRCDGPWRESPQAPRGRDARLTATRATDGRVPRGLVDTAGEARVSGRCRETTIAAPRVLRAWGRRRGMEPTVRTWQHLLATEACQVQTEAADDGPLVWRWLAGLVRFDTARVCWQGRVTLAAIVFSLKHHWRFLRSEALA